MATRSIYYVVTFVLGGLMLAAMEAYRGNARQIGFEPAPVNWVQFVPFLVGLVGIVLSGVNIGTS